MIGNLLLVFSAVILNGHDLKIAGDKYDMNWALSLGQYEWIQESDLWPTWGETFQDGEDIVQRFTFPHDGKTHRIAIPFNDNYPGAEECVTKRCHAHIWPGGTNGWVCAIRMGGKVPHLGLMITKGSFDGYAITKRGSKFGGSNFRGVIILLTKSNELEWRIFSHTGWDDFKSKLIQKGGTWVDYVPPADLPDFDTVLKKRLDFILENQVYHNPEDIRDGALIPYDNETKKQYCGWLQEPVISDRSEGRERVGMGILLAEAMRHGYTHPKAETTLRNYLEYVHRALQDDKFRVKGAADDKKKFRIYNFAWVTRLYFDAYETLGDEKYLDWGYNTAMAAFKTGGYNFYMIDFPILQSIRLLENSHVEVERGRAKLLRAELEKWASNIAKNGLNVPKFEVKYEQSIIAPAANTMAEMYLLTHDEKYLAAAKVLLPAVEAFNGHQPDIHLNDVGIRHWDGYWFGKRRVWGDTFPHYWSAITADFFRHWALITGDKSYQRRAENIIRAQYSLFNDDGSAGCAYLYADEYDGKPGKFLDPLANDQDWALVFGVRVFSEDK